VKQDDDTRPCGSALSAELGPQLRRPGVWVWHDQYARPEPAEYTRSKAPFEAADALDMQAKKIELLQSLLTTERQRIRGLVEAVRKANAESQDADDCLIYTPAVQRAWIALMAGLEGPNFELAGPQGRKERCETS